MSFPKIHITQILDIKIDGIFYVGCGDSIHLVKTGDVTEYKYILLHYVFLTYTITDMNMTCIKVYIGTRILFEVTQAGTNLPV